jgi:hypothetical protein
MNEKKPEQKPRRPVSITVEEAEYTFLVDSDRPAADQIRDIIRPRASQYQPGDNKRGRVDDKSEPN